MRLITDFATCWLQQHHVTAINAYAELAVHAGAHMVLEPSNCTRTTSGLGADDTRRLSGAVPTIAYVVVGDGFVRYQCRADSERGGSGYARVEAGEAIQLITGKRLIQAECVGHAGYKSRPQERSDQIQNRPPCNPPAGQWTR